MRSKTLSRLRRLWCGHTLIRQKTLTLLSRRRHYLALGQFTSGRRVQPSEDRAAACEVGVDLLVDDSKESFLLAQREAVEAALDKAVLRPCLATRLAAQDRRSLRH